MDKMEGQDNHYLKFYASGNHLLINVFNVHSIIADPKIVAVTQAPKYVKGVIVVEGVSVPLLDTGIRLNLSANGTSSQHSKVIVSIPSNPTDREEFMPIAFSTNDIDDVIIRNTNDLQPLPTEEEALDNRLFDGTYQLDDKLLMVLNIDNFYKEDFDEILKKNRKNKN